jgi:hypothetical protein
LTIGDPALFSPYDILDLGAVVLVMLVLAAVHPHADRPACARVAFAPEKSWLLGVNAAGCSRWLRCRRGRRARRHAGDPDRSRPAPDRDGPGVRNLFTAAPAPDSPVGAVVGGPRSAPCRPTSAGTGADLT